MKQDILFWNYNSNKNVMRNERVTQMYDQNISGMWCVSDLIKHEAQRHFFFFFCVLHCGVCIRIESSIGISDLWGNF